MISIADTSQGVFFFCDEATAEAIRAQVGREDARCVCVLPPSVYVIALPGAAEVEPVETTGTPPPFEIHEEAMRDAIARIRGR